MNHSGFLRMGRTEKYFIMVLIIGMLSARSYYWDVIGKFSLFGCYRQVLIIEMLSASSHYWEVIGNLKNLTN